MWGRGYASGFANAARLILKDDKKVKEFMKYLHKTEDGTPTLYTVANSCCGGVDAHDVGCRGR